MTKLVKKPTCCIKVLETAETSYQVQPDKNGVIAQYKLQTAKAELLLAQKHAQANIDFIKEELENLKLETQTLKQAITDVELLISRSLCKIKRPEKLCDLCKVKSCLQIELSNVLHLQRNFKKQIGLARLAYRNARIDDQLISQDIKKLKEFGWDERIRKKDALVKERILREVRTKKNATTAREETINSVANSITAHVLQLPERFESRTKHLQNAKVARQSVDKFIAKTIRKVRENKAIAITESQIRQRNQMENLTRLKKQINEIKQTLTTKNQLKRMHDEEIALEKEEVKHLLLVQGANPYLAEYLLAIEEKQREIQRKMLVEEQKHLLDMQREYAIIEASKTKEESHKKKWSQYWDKKVKDKISNERKSKQEMYYDHSEGEGEARESFEVAEKELHDTIELVESEEALGSHKGSNPTSPEMYEAVEEEDVEIKESLHERRHSKQESAGKTSSAKRHSTGTGGGSSKGRKSEDRPPSFTDDIHALSIRKAMHLDYAKKESLLKLAAEDFASVRIMLMNNSHVFNFGNVVIDEKKYVIVHVANLSLETVKLRMSLINPYGPFTFCNALKEIPPDNYFSLKFRYEPSTDGESEETVMITEISNPESYITFKLKGKGEYRADRHSLQ